MKWEKQNGAHRKVWLNDRVAVNFHMRETGQYEFRLVFTQNPYTMGNMLSFGKDEWFFEGRRDFLRRTMDMEKIIYRVFDEDKLYILKKIFKD
jgi:hypothetical protein